ncbi:hypothetical protein [Clostridium nigeriense]|uniref:hypothetical protein n=1 Tax=Clostridium nigeriense TaxID=1805470 RepID=UPI00082B77D0|nr:hypothetical protein [Clostridium nigeriense]
MKYYFEKNLKIINELMTYLYKLGSKNIQVNLHRDEAKTSFLISGEVPNIDDTELNRLKAILNTQRQHEVEEYYWHLGGESDAEGELSLVGMMIDNVDIYYNNDILKLEIQRNDF